MDQDHAGADARLTRHLRSWLGAWPPSGALEIVGSPLRNEPGWDGAPQPLIGVATPDGTVLSVPPERVAAVRAACADPDDAGWPDRVAMAMDAPGAVVGLGTFRSVTSPASVPALPALGEWLRVDDPVVPSWLHPFGGWVLIACDADGQYAAGVGVKRHDAHGRELAVGTVPAQRGAGLARRLVVTAARRLLDEGFAVTYLHDPANTGSARVAEAAGFADRGWQIIGLWPRS